MSDKKNFFYTNKTDEQLNSMSDEEYFIEVLKGTPNNHKSRVWWNRRGTGRRPSRDEMYKMYMTFGEGSGWRSLYL